MTRAFRKNIRKTITQSLGRYIAIFAIIALGVGFFVGLKSTKPSMIYAAEKFFHEQHMFDVKLVSTIGFNEEEIERIRHLDKVTEAEGAIYSDIMIESEEGTQSVLRVHSITNNVNQIVINAGRMAIKDDECVLDAHAFDESMIGKKILLSSENKEEDLEKFAYKEYTVVGLATSPLYINTTRGTTTLGNGSLRGFMYIPEGGFDFEYYTECYILSENSFPLYSKEYTEFSESLQDAIKPEVESLIQDRYDKLYQDAEDEILKGEDELEKNEKEAEEEFAKAEKELADAKGKLADAKIELESNKEKLDEAASAIDADYTTWESAVEAGWKAYSKGKEEFDTKIADASEQLEIASQELQNAKAEYSSGLAQYTENKAKYDEGYEQYKKGLTEYETQLSQYESTKDYLTDEQIQMYESQLTEAKGTLDATNEVLMQSKIALEEAKTNLDEAESSIQQGVNTYEASKAKFEAEKQQGEEQLSLSKRNLEQFESGVKAYREGFEEYEKGLIDYEEGYQTYLDNKKEAEKKFADAKEEIQEAKVELAKFETPQSYVLGRESNSGYASFDNDAQIVNDVAKVFPVFFFLIAALVCSTTMTRMVEDERTHIGTFRALGYGASTILWKYIYYAGSAATLGCLFGFFAGTLIFPSAIWSAYKMLYRFADIEPIYQINLLIISLIVSLLCSVGTTFGVCRNELRSYPADLIRPKAPQAGKRIFLERIGFLWKRMKFIHKVSARNIFRFKKRMIMMIMGISGCAALVLTGFGINDSVANIANFQYGDIMKYDISVTYRNPLMEEELSKIENSVGSDIDFYTSAYMSSSDLIHDKVTKSVYLIVTDDPNIERSIHFYRGEQDINYPKTGEIVITQKVADMLRANIGDEIEISIGDERAYVLVSDIAENYVNNYGYINVDTYEKYLDLNYEPTTMLVTLNEDANPHEVGAKLGDHEDVMNIQVTQDVKDMVNDMMNSLNFIVVLVIACAGALAFIVLFNLGNINISERVREIATIKVLGFHSKETGAYVFRENLVLVIMGIIVGLPLGIILHRFVMSQINVDMVTFKVVLEPLSFVYTVLTVLGFSVTTDFIMRFKIERIDMTESLKSIE